MRGGGHNPAGHCLLDGGLVIDLSQLRRVEVDGEANIAHAGGGSTWLDFDAATQAFGLVAQEAWSAPPASAASRSAEESATSRRSSG